MDKKRNYDEGCAAAHALDLVGERWALLVVRELLLGPKRFTDLRDGLPHVSPNVLAQRLRDLEAIGVVYRQKLPPPAASKVYALSAWGRGLEPVIVQLGRWGARSPAMPFASPTSVTSLILALRTMFDPEAAANFEGVLELVLGEETFQAHVHESELTITRGLTERPDATVTGTTDTFKGLAFADLPLAAASQTGDVTVSGNEGLAQGFFDLFKLPEPVLAVSA